MLHNTSKILIITQISPHSLRPPACLAGALCDNALKPTG
jgi:hypothetical protein